MINLMDIKIWLLNLKEKLFGENDKYWYYVNTYWVTYKLKVTHPKIPELEIDYFGNLTTKDFVWDQQEYFTEAFMKFNQEIKNHIIETMVFSEENLQKLYNKYPEVKEFQITDFEVEFEILNYSLLNSRKLDEIIYSSENELNNES